MPAKFRGNFRAVPAIMTCQACRLARLQVVERHFQRSILRLEARRDSWLYAPMVIETPFWWEDAGRPASPPEEPLPGEVDVLVIGAGLTGLSAALTLARRGKSVLVLDKGAPGTGASSRNGGQVGGGHMLSVDELSARYGRDTAIRILTEAMIGSTEFASKLIADEDIDCDYRQCGRFRGFWTDAEYDEAGRSLDALKKIVPVAADLVAHADQRQEIGSDLYRGGAVYHAHGAMNPAKYVAGLLRAVGRAGAVVQGDTPVTALLRSGAHHLAVTPRGEVRAGEVLVATNGYTTWALPRAKRRIIPVPSFIIATEPLGENRVRSLFPKMRVMTETRLRHCYYRPSPDGQRIVFGGRAAMFDVPEPFARRELETLMHGIFPDLGPVAITHSWRGYTGFSFSFTPNVGKLDGVWHAMGYSGNGNTMAVYLGNKAALQILGDPDGETAFSRTAFEPRWWHPGVTWFMPAADLKLRIQDLVANRRR